MLQARHPMQHHQESERRRLREVTERLLDPGTPPSTLRPEVLELVDLLAAAVGARSREEAITSGETRLAAGLALSPAMAAMCAEDFVRTIVFLRGLRAAVARHRAGDPGRPTRVLYAGTGPYATLAVPLMCLMDPAEVCFTLLEVHPEALRSAERVVRHFGLGDFVDRTHAVDALAHVVDPAAPPDVILVETMQACLDKEPQVAVVRHLAAQAPAAVLVPEEVRIDLRLVDVGREFSPCSGDGTIIPTDRDRLDLGPVFVLDRAALHTWAELGEDELPGRRVQAPGAWEDRHQPLLFTTVRVSGDHVLRDYDSGLTSPRVLPVPLAPGGALEVRYRLGAEPGLSFRAAEAPAGYRSRTTRRR